MRGSEISSNACLGVRPSEVRERIRSRSVRIAFNSLISRQHLITPWIVKYHEYAFSSGSLYAFPLM